MPIYQSFKIAKMMPQIVFYGTYIMGQCVRSWYFSKQRMLRRACAPELPLLVYTMEKEMRSIGSLVPLDSCTYIFKICLYVSSSHTITSQSGSLKCYHTVKPVGNGHSKIDTNKDLNNKCSLKKVKRIAECSPWSIQQYI